MRVARGGGEGVLILSKIGQCSHVPIRFPLLINLLTIFRPLICKVLFPCSLKIDSCSLFHSIFCQCSLVPQKPWETLINGCRCQLRNWIGIPSKGPKELSSDILEMPQSYCERQMVGPLESNLYYPVPGAHYPEPSSPIQALRVNPF